MSVHALFGAQCGAGQGCWPTTYLACGRCSGFRPLKTVPCERTVTVLHLLTHTSGLSYGFDAEGMANPVDYL